METEMTNDQFNEITRRLDTIEKNAVTKFDVFQSVLTVQGMFFAVLVGTVVMLNSIGMFD